MASLPHSEWSVWFDTDTLDDKPVTREISADEDARAALARRLNVGGIERLSATLTITPTAGGAVEVAGTMEADLAQTCVVTLEPLAIKVRESVEGWFTDRAKTVSFAKARQDRDTKKGHVEVEMLAEQEDPEDMTEGHIDLGELVTQHLSLAIDPYPHKEGAAFEVGDDAPPKPAKSPFEVLKTLKTGE